MAKITNINLINFRNFSKFDLNLHKKTNIFFGDNGSGKTNLLEAISLLSKGRGIRNSQIIELIKNNEKDFVIDSSIKIKDNDYNVKIFNTNKDDKLKKNILINEDNSRDAINFIDNSLSFILFLPEMERLFLSSPSKRRNFLDRLIFSSNKDYNRIINKYKKNLIERNKILLQNQYDINWINIIESEISKLGLNIYELRNLQINLLNNHLKNLTNFNKYKFKIELKIKDNLYEQNLSKEKYLSFLLNSREYDKKFGGSRFGPHKSDFYVTINDEFDANQLSTGQQKTLILMLLLAQCDYLLNNKNIKPVLLFDEICSHLDSNNRKLLLDMINNFDIQFFLTGTEKTLFSFISTNVEFYNITKL